MKKIGIVGGTFDPIHIGHILLGEWAYEQYSLDEVWFMPAGMPYFKKDKKVTPAKERLENVRAAVSSFSYMKVCDLEVMREGRTYTYETVEELNRLYPDNRFCFIFGEDCLDTLETWREPGRILAGCEIIAATRGSASDPEKMKEKASALCEKLGGVIHIMEFPALDISSTMIRERIAKGLSVKYLVP
ncbi:MAG: nicotinate-nucleotide adenylyltransferase [Lachnospiraceae bacterium]|nr:nicotinate-nucleotide adenylyltransferase [Lachnospiraceae bacterium]